MPKIGIGLSLITSILSALAPPVTIWAYVTDKLKLYFNFAKESESDAEILGTNRAYTGHKEVQFVGNGSTSFGGAADKIIALGARDNNSLANTTGMFWAKDFINDGGLVSMGALGHKSVIFWFSSKIAWTRGWYSAIEAADSDTGLVSTGKWHHIAYAFDGTDGYIWVDGKLYTKAAHPLTTGTWAHDIYLGGYTDGAWYDHNGSMALFGFWDRLLSTEEVNAIMYKKGSELNVTEKQDLKVWYDLDAIAKFINFDGSSDYGSLTMPALSDTHSFACWFYNHSSAGGDNVRMFLDWTGNNLYYGTRNDKLYTYDYSSTAVYGDTTLAVDTWYHVVFVRNGTSGVTYYLNSVVDGTADTVSKAWVGSSTVGGRTASYGHDGLLAGLSVWDKALSSAEVAELYAIDRSESVSGHSAFSASCKGHWLMDHLTTVQDLTSSNADITITNAQTAMEDLSGNGNNGLIEGGTVQTASIYGNHTPKMPRSIDVAVETYGDAIGLGSYDFDGSADNVAIGHSSSLNISSNLTITAWVKPEGASANGYVVAKTDYDGTGGWSIFWNGGSNLVGNFYGSSASKSSSAVFTDADNWVHVAHTVTSGGAWEFFRNGLSAGSGTGLSLAANTLEVRIATKATAADSFFEGSVSQVGIWSRVLTSAEINSVMEKTYSELTTAEKVDLEGYWELDTAPLKALDFDGSNDYVDMGTAIPTAFGDSFAGPFSVSLWIRPDTVTADDGYFTIYDGSGHGVAQLTFWQNGGKNLYQWLLDDTGGYQWSINYEVFAVNAWHHIVAIYDGSDVTKSVLYIDGVAGTKISGDADGSHPATMDMDGLSVHFGRYYGTTQSFDGAIAKAAIWEKDMSGSASTLYNLGIEGDWSGVESSDLKGYWDMTGDPAIEGIHFDNPQGSISDVCDVSIPALGDDYSISVWIKRYTDAGASAESHFVETNPNTYYFGTRKSGGTLHKLNVYPYGASGGSDDLYSSTELALNTWYHCVVTQADGGSRKLYVNGSLDATDSDIYTRSFSGTTNWDIGSRNGTAHAFDGAMSGLGFWNKELSASEVTELYGIDKFTSASSHSAFSANCKGYYMVGSNTLDDQTSGNNDIVRTAGSSDIQAIADSSANSNTATISGATHSDGITLDSTSNNNDGAIN